jgi:hypothetical protein
VRRLDSLAWTLVAPPTREEFDALLARVARVEGDVARVLEWAVAGSPPPTVSEGGGPGEEAV